MKTPEEMAKEYVKQEQLEYEEASGAYYGFLAGYKAAQVELLQTISKLEAQIDNLQGFYEDCYE